MKNNKWQRMMEKGDMSEVTDGGDDAKKMANEQMKSISNKVKKENAHYKEFNVSGWLTGQGEGV